MGAWGSGPFDNDTAADWRYGLVDAVSEGEALGVIESALRAAADLPESAYLDADQGSCALAAAAVVAAARGKDLGELPEDVAEWLETHGAAVPAAFRTLAQIAIARTLGSNSELAELWAESGDADELAAESRKLVDGLA